MHPGSSAIDAWCSRYERAGYRPVPLAANAKVPPRGFPLAAHFQGEVPAADLRRWFTPDGNIGLVTDRLVVADFDVKTIGQEFVDRHRDVLKTVVETARGFHGYFQSPGPGVPTQRLAQGDLKGAHGYVVAPPSIVDGWRYRFVENHGLVPLADLPVFSPEMLMLPNPANRPLTRKPVTDAVRYVMTIDSVQGQHGSHGLVRACAILRDAGFTEAEATVVLIEWNRSGKAVPPWPLPQLTRAISRTYQSK